MYCVAVGKECTGSWLMAGSTAAVEVGGQRPYRYVGVLLLLVSIAGCTALARGCSAGIRLAVALKFSRLYCCHFTGNVFVFADAAVAGRGRTCYVPFLNHGADSYRLTRHLRAEFPL